MGKRAEVVGVEGDLGLDTLAVAVVAFAVGVACHDCRVVIDSNVWRFRIGKSVQRLMKVMFRDMP